MRAAAERDTSARRQPDVSALGNVVIITVMAATGRGRDPGMRTSSRISAGPGAAAGLALITTIIRTVQALAGFGHAARLRRLPLPVRPRVKEPSVIV